ncbi:hypothetical protein MesoLjLc_14640 [Mesorhizobium sp. L-8-10]|uniref:hypothetical protein n=1 Tax=Mesorhizobium sp. L-8-10 TaxID=2744523 RepID=UPI001925A49A|nr:hypothetical protein [Mesorhizobium sp. L-8-10]BCH29534.1 hypothetical protein MesoLjLc_14640 [Mesorhizobium sp. L-8-10]
MSDELIGMGVYTPSEAGRLLHIPAARITRWLRGHRIGEQAYEPLWRPEVTLDDRVFLGFRDLMEVRVVDAFIRAGVPALRLRMAIQLARDILGNDHPLSTNHFRTDGREIFLRVIETDPDGSERERLLNLFRRQYEFNDIINPILKTVDFDDHGAPFLWWPGGRRLNVVVDPARSFGQPIDAASSVPTAVLAAAAKTEGVQGAATAFEVSEASVRRAIEFEASMEQKLAA